MTQPAGAHRARPRDEWLGWAFAALALLWAYAVHQGLGPAPSRLQLAWYEPRGFFYGMGWLDWALASPARIMVVFTLPAALCAGAVFLTTRSAIARALALSSVVACLLFGFYGEVAVRIWEFFFWRGSAVLALTALVVGFALAAPFLARSWLRLSWPLRAASYLPVCFAVIALLRNATGTDPSLRFAISPWPAIAVFGVEVGALFVMVWLLGAALGVAGIARARAGPGGRGAGLAGVALGIAVPLALLALGSGLALLPFRAGPATLGSVALACAVAIALAGATAADPARLRSRARHLGVGAALIALPLVAGEVWANLDYRITREGRARELIDAMERYYAERDLYPDELDELVDAGYLARIPEPAIGFGFLYEGQFRYRSFGTSYILEFPASRWVECAYSPGYADEEDEEDPDVAADAGEDADFLGESWSCPSRPPELW